MPCCEISDCAQMSKTIIAFRHFGLGGHESLETAVIGNYTCSILVSGEMIIIPGVRSTRSIFQ